MTAAIHAEGLTKTFGSVHALASVDITAERGRITALLGPNGAGKTTFVRTVATLLQPDSGRLVVHGIDVREQPAAVRRMISLTGQFAAVEEAMTGRENIELFARLFGQGRVSARRSTGALIERLDLADVADRMVRTYSGGMRRRLDLAASLVGNPRLLLLDEPTTGLDPRSRRAIWERVGALVDTGTDVLLTTQYLEEADRLADDITIIDEGRVVATGTPTNLKKAVGESVIEVRVRNPSATRTVESTLADVMESGQVRSDPGARSVTVTVQSSTSSLAVAASALDRAGIEVEDVVLRHPTLDEAFLALTERETPSDSQQAGPLTAHPSD